MERTSVGKFSVEDKIRHVSGSHVYTILAIKTERGRYVAQVDPEHPDFWMDLADVELVEKDG